ncbi:MAG: glycosyltransferase family 9 protein, partial [Desulfobacteraceae bacterium]|nr:glycosyltransferase family 9 protein [Desulfobacteraceae bacterium]
FLLGFTPRPTADPSQRNFARILAISTTAVGDTVLSTPCFNALRRLNPRARIVALIRDRYIPMFRTNPDLDGIIPHRKGWAGFLHNLNALKKENFDAAFVFHVSDPGPVGLAALAGIPFIAGKSLHPPFDPLFTLRTFPDYSRHTIARRLAILRLMYPGFSDWPTRLVLPQKKEETDRARQKMGAMWGRAGHRGPVVGLQPGASRPYKIWPQERFVDLARRLLATAPDLNILILGDKSEAALGKAIADGVEAPGRIVSLCGQTRIAELPAVISGLDFLVTNDTGSLHIAIAVGTPTLSLFAATDPGSSGPYQDQERHIVIAKPKPCGSGCVHKKCPLKPSCMTQITVAEVYQRAVAMLAKPSGRLALPTAEKIGVRP